PVHAQVPALLIFIHLISSDCWSRATAMFRQSLYWRSRRELPTGRASQPTAGALVPSRRSKALGTTGCSRRLAQPDTTTYPAASRDTGTIRLAAEWWRGRRATAPASANSYLVFARARVNRPIV